MGNPYDKEVLLEKPLCLNGVLHEVGETIKLKSMHAACFEETQPEADNEACCFPEYCISSQGVPTDGYRVRVLVPAGATVEQPVASIEGCAPPNMVCFHYCSSCLFVSYDAAPVLDPADPLNVNGGAADPNPTCRDLIEKGVCVQTIFMHNPSADDVVVTLSYYC